MFCDDELIGELRVPWGYFPCTGHENGGGTPGGGPAQDLPQVQDSLGKRDGGRTHRRVSGPRGVPTQGCWQFRLQKSTRALGAEGQHAFLANTDEHPFGTEVHEFAGGTNQVLFSDGFHELVVIGLE